MTTELQMLSCAIGLGLLQLALAATFSVARRGLGWAVGARDETPEPLGRLGGRIERAARNFLETFVFFAAAVLLLHATSRGNATSTLGAQVYLWARLLYLPAYALGVPYLRTLIWAASLAGIIMVLMPLF